MWLRLVCICVAASSLQYNSEWCVCVAGWNLSDVEAWYAGLVRQGLSDRTLAQLRASVVTTLVAYMIDGRDVDARMKAMPPAQVAFIASVCSLEMGRASWLAFGGVLPYLTSAGRPEGAMQGA